MNLDALLGRLTREAPTQLLGGYTYRGARRLLELGVFHAVCLELANLEKPWPHAPGATATVESDFVTPARLREETRDAESGLTAEQVETALGRGETCFGVFIDGSLASHTWFSKGAAHLRAKVFVEFGTAFAYSRWSFTRREYRGQHLHGFGKRRALEAMSKDGCRGILSVIEVDNAPSLRSAAHTGCHRAGWLLMAQAAGRTFVRASDGCRVYGLRPTVD